MYVLIDTWWNVNTEKKLSSLESIGFNRYMVECELIMFVLFRFCRYVLIDTWWNVNIRILLVPASASGVLIDTWWNVNESPELTP